MGVEWVQPSSSPLSPSFLLFIVCLPSLFYLQLPRFSPPHSFIRSFRTLTLNWRTSIALGQLTFQTCIAFPPPTSCSVPYFRALSPNYPSVTAFLFYFCSQTHAPTPFESRSSRTFFFFTLLAVPFFPFAAHNEHPHIQVPGPDHPRGLRVSQAQAKGPQPTTDHPALAAARPDHLSQIERRVHLCPPKLGQQLQYSHQDTNSSHEGPGFPANITHSIVRFIFVAQCPR